MPGCPEGRVIDMVKKDNLTLQRPRIELQFLPEKYTRTGRVLGVRRTALQQERTRELYEVVQTVNANVLADDRPWLEASALPLRRPCRVAAMTAGETGSGFGHNRRRLDALRTSVSGIRSSRYLRG